MRLVSTILRFLECAFVILACGMMNAAEYSGNPVIDGWYADPEGIVIDDSYWIFPTYSAPFREQLYMDAFPSKDLVHWEKHPRIPGSPDRYH